ncbi:PilZ domain-containing protein [Geoalkalibacter halelectricus]|uniref:PilZ domain-containing protein n=1 Tax=Geoalkalibacter halelectricus TaxID=2847045 RepID=A0ABY5ZM07_9BACT|nr:PilZ domain-containing protein [Geoalkalibacter halelectricus]MDO3378478.1 PilZ domain-containing protein [Geoalkalibacter halelectricus]UWZ80202.1 PilZ domain-containing protein [Geoalkalibacter halelectricus]
MTKKGTDKRTQKRRNTIYYLEVFDLESGRLLGRLVDITVAGMMLISESPITPDRTYKCRMSLPADILGRSNILFDATCVWSRKALNSDFFEAGFRSLIADPGDIDAIEMLIQRFAFSDL